MSVITLDGEIIHYEVLGRGRPLIFLHGWVGSWRYWVPTMQAASISYRAYALDMWGFGDTAKRESKYGLEEQVRLLGEFLEAMGIGRIALVGHGFGAVVALSFAANHNAVVDRLMLVGLPMNSTSISPRLHTAPMQELVDWLLARLPATDSARLEAPKTDPLAVRASLEGLQAVHPQEMTKSLPTPVLLVHGQNDPVVQVPPAETLNGLPEQSHYIIFEQSGHFPMLDEANKYNRLLGDFLALGSGESPRQLQLKEEWKRRVR